MARWWLAGIADAANMGNQDPSGPRAVCDSHRGKALSDSGMRSARHSGVPLESASLPHDSRRDSEFLLLGEAQRHSAARSHVAEIGVSMTTDYGAAQRRCVKHGRVRDGSGSVAARYHLSWGSPKCHRLLVGSDSGDGRMGTIGLGASSARTESGLNAHAMVV